MPEIPSGIVTFVFTDIEGSTRLWQDEPEAMKTALECHDALLRKIIEKNGGYVFKTVGDAFCAAFHSPLDAVRATVAFQQGLKETSWPPNAVIRVRASIHTGEASLRDNDYFGVNLSRVGRLLSAGHGGQVLVSSATHQLVQDELPPQVTFRPMGTHRLRDLSRPDEIFQLEHPDLDHDFPALKTLDNRPNNLPRPRTSFIGRELELLDLEELSKKSQLLTLTGMGGTGKTRLAIEFAADLLGQFDKGVWFVDLAPLTDPDLVPHAVATVFKFGQEEGKTLTETLVEKLADKATLVVIDNCEHLLDASATLIDELLRGCPKMRIVATSREALGIPGEQVYRVRSLPLPKVDGNITALAECDSVRLFLERATLAKHDFSLTDENAPAVSSICSHLDGIPLAIELAAARLRAMSPADISLRLDKKFRLLTGGSKTALKRQQTLLGLVDWSYDLLNEREQALLQRLSVFRGGWTARLAEMACSDDLVDEFDVLDLLSQLVEKSLIFTEGTGTSFRYRILETVRDYAAEKLSENDPDSWRDRHLLAITNLVESMANSTSNTELEKMVGEVKSEEDNIREALIWSTTTEERAEIALKLISSIRPAWHRGTNFREAFERSVAALDVAKGDPKLRARALIAISNLGGASGHMVESIAHANRAAEIAQELGDHALEVVALQSLANRYGECGEYERSVFFYEKALDLARQTGDEFRIATVSAHLGVNLAQAGRGPEGEQLTIDAIASLESIGRSDPLPVHFNNLGYVQFTIGKFDEAEKTFKEAMERAQSQSDDRIGARINQNLSSVLVAQGRLAEAKDLLEFAMQFAVNVGEVRLLADSLEVFAALSLAEGNFVVAAKSHGKADSLRDETGIGLPKMLLPRRSATEESLRAHLGDESYEIAYQKGRVLTIQEAADLCQTEEKTLNLVDGQAH